MKEKGSGVNDASSATDTVKVKFFGRDGLGYGECHRQKDSALKKSFMRKTLLFNSPDFATNVRHIRVLSS